MSSTRRDSPSSGFGATREDFAAGDVLIRFPLSEIPRLLILSPIEKPGWRSRVEGTQMRAVHPGSAVHFEDRLYEVRRITASPRDGTTRYELWPWEEQLVLRDTFEYSREECERVAAFVRDVKRKQAAAHSLAWILPLVGLLPARVQIAIEEEYSLPAARATFWSALMLFAASTLAVLVGGQCVAALALAGPKPAPISLLAMRLLPASVYFLLESMVRFRMSFPAGIPMGSAPVAVPVLLLLGARDAMRRRPAPTPAAKPAPRRPSTLPDDEVRDLPDARVEILSALDKPHWGPRTAIHFRSLWWALSDRGTDARANARPWRFVLEPWPEHLLVQEPAEYSPDEVHGLAFDTARDRHRATVFSLGALFGLLPPEAQAPLAEVYGHDPRSQTGWSIVAVGLTAALTLWHALARLALYAGSWGEALLALLAAVLLVESTWRGVVWLQGRLVGSLLSPLVRPLAARVLDLGRPA